MSESMKKQAVRIGEAAKFTNSKKVSTWKLMPTSSRSARALSFASGKTRQLTSIDRCKPIKVDWQAKLIK